MKKLGFWLGYTGKVGTFNDGIGRLLLYQVDAFLKYCKDINIEIWAPSFIAEDVWKLLAVQREKYPKRLTFYIEDLKTDRFYDNKQRLQNLINICNRESDCDLFIIPIITLESGLLLKHKRVVWAHDLIPCQLFSTGWKEYQWESVNGQRMSKLYSDQKNVRFTCNSEWIRDNHFCKFTPGLSPDRFTVVKVPCMVNRDIEIREFKDLQKQYKIRRPYLIYPTRNRAYKNITHVLKALLKTDLNIVLTDGTRKEQEGLMRQLKDRVIITRNVNEQDLFSLYHHSASSVTASYIEGALQAPPTEGWTQGTPAIIANIPVIQEFIKGYEKDLLLFDPGKTDDLVRCMKAIQDNRAGELKKQMAFIEKYLAYTWEEGIKNYRKAYGL